MSTNGCEPTERSGETWRRTAQRRKSQTSHVGDQVGLARRDPGVRRRQQREQETGIIVDDGDRGPPTRRRRPRRQGPLGQQRRLAVARRRADTHHRTAARPSPLDHLRAAARPPGEAAGPTAWRRPATRPVHQPSAPPHRGSPVTSGSARTPTSFEHIGVTELGGDCGIARRTNHTKLVMRQASNRCLLALTAVLRQDLARSSEVRNAH